MQRTILLLIVVLVLIIAGFFIADPESGKAVLVDFGLIQNESETYVLSGLVEAERTILSSAHGGKVTDLMVSEGDEVKSGDPLVQLDTSALELELAAAQARLQIAQGYLDLLLESPRSIDLAVAEAAVAKAQVIRDAAVQALEDTRDALPEGGPEERIELAELDLEKAELGLETAERNREKLEKGPPESAIEQAQAGIRAARAEVSDIQRRIDEQEIHAPLEGTVLDIYLKNEEIGLPSLPILALADIRTLSVTVYLPETDFSQVEIGQEVTVQVESLPGQTFVGTITSISDQAEFTPRNVQTPRERVILVFAVEVSIPNPELILKPGIPVEVNLGVES